MKIPIIGKLFSKKEKDAAAEEAEVSDKGKKKAKKQTAGGNLHCPVCAAKGKYLIQEGDLVTCIMCGAEFKNPGGKKPVIKEVSESAELIAPPADDADAGPEEFMSPGGISVPDVDDFAENKLEG